MYKIMFITCEVDYTAFLYLVGRIYSLGYYDIRLFYKNLV